MPKEVTIGPDQKLTTAKVELVAAYPYAKVRVSSAARVAVKKSREIVEKLVARKQVVYGLTTGFGKFKDRVISPENTALLQKNLIRSHSVGVGDILPEKVVRAALLVRLNSLIIGHSGVREILVDTALNLLNKGVTPIVPSQGSVGASGDLAPLSHAGLVLMGEGEAWYKGVRMSGKEALKKAGIKPIDFSSKEGLAWNNGTAFMTGIAALNVQAAKRLIEVADIAAALTLEAVAGMSTAFDPRIHNLRPHPGQIQVAANIRKLIRGSRLIDTFPKRVQDSYTLRCTPQVHGAVRDAVAYVEEVVTRELSSVTDNPLIFPTKPFGLSGGNFHGQPISIAMDFLRIAIADLANISERRTAKLVDPSTSEGLPLFLMDPEKGGLNNGLMMPQYTAAALVSENKILTHPASVDSIPTSAGQEDHVSMGTISSRKTMEVIGNAVNVLAIEFLSATQGIDFRGPKKLGAGTSVAYKLIRKYVPTIKDDRIFYPDMENIASLINGNKITFEVEKTIGSMR